MRTTHHHKLQAQRKGVVGEEGNKLSERGSKPLACIAHEVGMSVTAS